MVTRGISKRGIARMLGINGRGREARKVGFFTSKALPNAILRYGAKFIRLSRA
jgi:hypothetical protein